MSAFIIALKESEVTYLPGRLVDCLLISTEKRFLLFVLIVSILPKFTSSLLLRFTITSRSGSFVSADNNIVLGSSGFLGLLLPFLVTLLLLQLTCPFLGLFTLDATLFFELLLATADLLKSLLLKQNTRDEYQER